MGVVIDNLLVKRTVEIRNANVTGALPHADSLGNELQTSEGAEVFSKRFRRT